MKNGITLPPHQNYRQDDEIQHHRFAKIYVINGKTKMSQMHFYICEIQHQGLPENRSCECFCNEQLEFRCQLIKLVKTPFCSCNQPIGNGLRKKRKDSSGNPYDDKKCHNRFPGRHRMVDPIVDSSQQEQGDDCYSAAEQYLVTVPVGKIITNWK